MLVLNLKVNSDKLINDILEEDNSSETIPKIAVYRIAKRNTLSTASNPNIYNFSIENLNTVLFLLNKYLN